MFSNRLAFAVLGIACVAAAAGGGYLATRQSTAIEAAPTTAVTPEPTSRSAQPVEETEALVADSTKGAVTPRAEEAVGARRPAATSADAPPRAAARRAPPAERTTARASEPPVPVLERSWPSGSATPAAVEAAPTPTVEERSVVEPLAEPLPPPEPERRFEELVVSANSVIGLQLDSAVSSERARVEDRVEARVVRDVRVGSEVAIPAGSRAIGSVMVVEPGGKFKERARLGVRFHTLVLADGTRLPISTETIYRDGEARGNSSAAKIGGGAVAGAILGAVIGGAKGAAVGATAGAGGGTAAVMAGDASVAAFPLGTELTARILSPVTVTIEK